mgnify:CR=1 FL=1
MANIPLMKCGHAAQGINHGQPVCIVCYGIFQGADEVDHNPPSLGGRMARCTYYPNGGKYGKCESPQPSSTKLALFSYRPEAEFDDYFCGCWGWD